MNIRLYITMTDENNAKAQEIRDRFRQLEDTREHFSEPKVRLYGFNLRQNEEGTYVEYDHFLVGVPTALTEEAGLEIRRVEMYEEFPNPSRFDSEKGVEPKFQMPLGLYKHEESDASAIVDEFSSRNDNSSSMRLRIVATKLADAVTLFNLIRTGEIEPVEPWIDAPKGVAQGGKVLELTTK